METTLHRQLKARYAASDADMEVRVEGYRIDAIVADPPRQPAAPLANRPAPAFVQRPAPPLATGRLVGVGVKRGAIDAGGVNARQLVEIQSASLGQIRAKVRRLLERHALLVVKPIAARTVIVHTERGEAVSRRRSPKRGRLLDLFVDLVHFGDVFPHPRLAIEVMLIEQEEWRAPRRGRARWRRKDHRVLDRRLLEVQATRVLRTAGDLWNLLECDLPEPFSTAMLAQRLGEPRWLAQKIAYCLRQSGAARVVAKHGSAWQYAAAERCDVRAA